MKNTLAIVLLAASSIVLYRSSNPKVKHERLRWKIQDDGPFYHRYPYEIRVTVSSSSSRNCTFISCYDTSRCVLNSTHITFYFQPLVEFVDKVPSLLLSIYKLLEWNTNITDSIRGVSRNPTISFALLGPRSQSRVFILPRGGFS